MDQPFKRPIVRFQFSLATLFLVVTFIAIQLGLMKGCHRMLLADYESRLELGNGRILVIQAEGGICEHFRHVRAGVMEGGKWICGPTSIDGIDCADFTFDWFRVETAPDMVVVWSTVSAHGGPLPRVACILDIRGNIAYPSDTADENQLLTEFQSRKQKQ